MHYLKVEHYSNGLLGNQRGNTMLILSRRIGETIQLGDEVTVTVLSLKGNQVRIGINAPIDIEVHRQEIYERLKKNRASNSSHAGVARI